ncbi:MAG: hypothetical protein QOH88_3117 [Verrucomicrobiota bacterium]|jgi:lipopolysaccharide biosynthesis glycosyltransferase
MMGVTIGVGPLYIKAARVAAACLQRHTGIKTQILTEEHLTAASLRHPAALKLKIFDYVSANTILYFDADWFCIREWTPQVLAGDRRVIACHDFVTKADWPDQSYSASSEWFRGRAGHRFLNAIEGAVRGDYVDGIRAFAGVTLPHSTWFNSGMFIVNREWHAAWLQEAERIYREPHGHHDKYFEQPALLIATERLKMRVAHLPRKYNVLVASEQDWPVNMVGAHIKCSKQTVLPYLISDILQDRATPESVASALFAGANT